MEYKSRIISISYILALIISLSFIYYPSAKYLFNEWMTNDEYSHGPLLVIIALFIVWKKRFQISSHIGRPSWYGPLILFFGLVLAVGSIQGDIVKVTNYSLIIVLLGIALSLGGRLLLKDVLFPLVLLFMTIPLPYLVNVLLTRKLQMISSELGAWFIGLFSIPVYLEGNVIELENYRLLVEEACSGLNYLYSLVSIGIIWSYFFRAPRLHKVLLVLSTVPIAVFMNGARVGVTGILVHTSGIEVAEGFMHEFEGLVIFLVTCLLLIPVVWLLTLMQKSRPAFSEIFDFKIAHEGPYAQTGGRLTSPAALVGLGLVAAVAFTMVNSSDFVAQHRLKFSSFPSRLGVWKSSTQNLPEIIQDVLRADDYYLGDFKHNGKTINLYMVYYEKQLRQKAIHSPLVCLPGSGWVIEKQDAVDARPNNGPAINLNKLIINKEGDKQLVYYWVQQQGKSFSNDFLARASLITNALISKRTDGGLVRLTTPIIGGNVKQSEEMLDAFLNELASKVDQYIPD
jgi:exosortase D (VPLPA-CTERM-specific)